MTSGLETDTRLDPRIRKFFAGMNTGAPQPNVASREELMAQETSAEGVARYAAQVALSCRRAAHRSWTAAMPRRSSQACARTSAATRPTTSLISRSNNCRRSTDRTPI